MKLEMLRVFQVTAEQGSLSRAAAVLGRTPSAVSMMLRQLEQDLGGPLFETDRKNRLSALGAVVLVESRRANDAFDRSTKAIRQFARSNAGTVRIAAVPSATVSLLPPIIAAFRRERPDVRLEISDTDSATVRWRVQFDAADIGIVSAAPGDTLGGELIQSEPLGIVCRKDGAIARRIRQGTAPSWDLIGLESFVVNPLCDLVANEAVQKQVALSGLEARNTTALLSFVRAGLGATILPHSAVQGGWEDLCFIAPTDPVARRELRKICHSGPLASPVVQAFWDAL